MIVYLEALAAFAQTGSMARAGLRLRITQSAVSKRIAALEAQLGATLIEKHGRQAVLTPAARQLLDRSEPLMAALRDALTVQTVNDTSPVTLTVGVAEAVLSSWGARYLRRAVAKVPNLRVEIHSHRSPVVAERIGAGDYALGIVTGVVDLGRGLIEEPLGEEPMLVIPSRLESVPRPNAHKPMPVITIEERSGTWAAIARRAKQAGLVPEQRVETFFAAASMALAGYGHALVPLGVATTLKLPAAKLITWPEGRLTRPIVMVTRPAMRERPAVAALIEALKSMGPQLTFRGSRET